MATLIKFIKAIPPLVNLVQKFHEAWLDSLEYQDINKLEEKKKLRAFYRKKIEGAKTDEELINYHRTLHYINIK